MIAPKEIIKMKKFTISYTQRHDPTTRNPKPPATTDTFVLCKQSRGIHYPIHVCSLNLIVLLVLLVLRVLLFHKNRQNFNRGVQTQTLSSLPPLHASDSDARLQEGGVNYISIPNMLRL